MEKYIITSPLPRVIKTTGKYKNIVYNKYSAAYGADAANEIFETAKNILISSLKQSDDQTKNNNVLLVGMVQSGKTSNLEMLTALSFDNDYNTMIIYGGYDSFLLRQCVDRFTETFKTEDVIVLSTDSSDFKTYDQIYFDDKIKEGKKFIICSMKRPDSLNRINECLKKIQMSKVKPFIIDDEGDQASLNTQIFKNEASATYSSICKMKTLTKNPLYYAVTATPQANIFQPDISELKPDGLHLIKPGKGYNGASCFHLNDNNIHKVDQYDNNELENNEFPNSLRHALYHFIIASAIMRTKNLKYSDMIVHVFRETEGHSKIYNKINDVLKDIKDCYNNSNFDGQKYHLNNLKKIYEDPAYFSDDVRLVYKWDETMEINIKRVIASCLVVKQNSKNKIKNEHIQSYNHRIYIGGDLLQRGITFKNLVTTYFTRWPEKGNMDTSLQRARWFGYREKIIDLMKLFTTEKIKREFAELSEIEEDLWEQFRMVENGQLKLDDIVISASDTSLIPTRKNVAKYEKTKFASNWTNQRTIVNDVEDIKYNNNLFLKLIENENFNPSSVGRYDGSVSNYFTSNISRDKIIEFLNNSRNIFNTSPFSVNELRKLLNETDNICIQMMTSFNGLIESRRRTVDDGKISYLKQGASYSGNIKQYEGDSAVINNTQAITIQVSKITPIINNEGKNNLTQFMFSFRFPNKRTVYKKGR